MNEKRNRPITINLTPTQAEQVQKLAEADRRKVAEYLYYLLTDAIAEKLQELEDIKNAVQYDKKTGYTNIKI